MLVIFLQTMVNIFVPTLVDLDDHGRCNNTIDSQIRPSKRAVSLDLLQNILCVFQFNYFGVGVIKKGHYLKNIFLTIP